MNTTENNPVAPNGIMVRFGNVIFHYRDALFPIVFVTLALLFPPKYIGGNAGLDHIMDIIGLIVTLSGQSLRVAVIGLAYIVRGGRNRQVYADNLVIEGFFAHCRNPLYVGNLLVFIGLMLIHGSPYFILIGSAFYIFAYMAITAAEEQFLHQKFGEEYEEYCRNVPRFIPRFQGLSKTMQQMEFDWQRVIRKEYGSTFTWMTCALALFLWETRYNLGTEAFHAKLPVAGCIFGVVLIAYLTARVLKKTKRLGHD